MIAKNLTDEIDCGSFFDHIDDLLDFPVEDFDSGLPPAGKCGDSLTAIWPNESSVSVFSANSNSDLSDQLSAPYEDFAHLEWLSNFVDDSYTDGSLTMNKLQESSTIDMDYSTHNQFQTSSPISVLESSSSCSSDNRKINLPRSPEPTITTTTITAHGHRGRARSKRPRPPTFSPRLPIQLISPASSVTETTHEAIFVPTAPSDSDNFAESRPLIDIQPKQHNSQGLKKCKKMKFSFPPTPTASETNQNSSPPLQSSNIRKCMHCEITKTPQWRAGPMGPKTLCNACGVRFKSGRLFPEYRPAASPTFIPSLHSNSHKKVLEMRNKSDEKTEMTICAQPELIPNTNTAISMGYV